MISVGDILDHRHPSAPRASFGLVRVVDLRADGKVTVKILRPLRIADVLSVWFVEPTTLHPLRVPKAAPPADPRQLGLVGVE